MSHPHDIYDRLWADAGALEDRATRYAVETVIDDARVNADDTVYTERAAPEGDWDSLFRGTIALDLSSNPYPQAVTEFFVSRGLTF